MVQIVASIIVIVVFAGVFILGYYLNHLDGAAPQIGCEHCQTTDCHRHPGRQEREIECDLT